ncbi:MAG: hypothetical protein AAFS04_11980 [Cyanobacteria bacterium J06631_9]
MKEGKVLIYIAFILALIIFSVFFAGRFSIEAVAVKADGKILLVRGGFLGDQLEECVENGLQLTCKPYKISF